MSRLWTTPKENPFTDRTILMAVQSLWVNPLNKAIQEEGGHPLLVNNKEEAFSFLNLKNLNFLFFPKGRGRRVPSQFPFWNISKKCPPAKEERFLLSG